MIMAIAELNKLVENTCQLIKDAIYLQPHSQADREYYRDMIDQLRSNLLEIIEAKIREALDAHLDEYVHSETPLIQEEIRTDDKE